MKKFFELSYDEQWFLFFICKEKNKSVGLKISSTRLTSSTKSSESHKHYNFETEPLYPSLCDATKKKLTVENYDEKMKCFSEIINSFIQNGILSYDEHTITLKLTNKGDVFLQSQLIEPLKKITSQKINVLKKNFFKEYDSKNVELNVYVITKKNTPIEDKGHHINSFLSILKNSLDLDLHHLSLLIMSIDTLTMNFINFIAKLLLQ